VTGNGGARWGVVGPVEAIADGQAHAVYVAGHPLVIVMLDERIYAVDGRCPHRNTLLPGGPLAHGTIRCPLHGFRYDVRGGDCVWPPGWPGVRTYETRVEGTALLVRMDW
jgi:nitrite reductase/ring-hydroxylating ferredoxin subunit